MNIWGNTPDDVVNVIGHISGVVIFGQFLLLILRRGPASARPAGSGRLALWAGLLALTWNLASLVVLALPEGSEWADPVATLGFSALSFLPAVLLSVAFDGRQALPIRSGYALSTVSVGLHVAELFGGPADLHRTALGLITLGFGLLTVFAVITSRAPGTDPRQARTRLLMAMSLFLFAISFVHFSEGESHQAWSTELAVHHAGIPLALFILIQDYRFVLLDAFLRFLANGLLAGIFAVALVVLLPQLGAVGQILLAGILLAAFAGLRGWTLDFLTRIVFRQTDSGTVLDELRQLAIQAPHPDAYLRAACLRVAELMDATVVELPSGTDAGTEEAESGIGGQEPMVPTLVAELAGPRDPRLAGAEVVVPVRLPHSTVRMIFLSERKGGRRYLSRDLETLARLSAAISAHLEQIRETELQRLAAQAELRALQAQIHPHFLFNALNTLYGIIPRDATPARQTLLNLADILRYFLRSEKTFIALTEELRIVQAYLAIERLRLGEKLRVTVKVDPALENTMIPVLSIEPLVENAVKHGIAPVMEGGDIVVDVRREQGKSGPPVARILVSDTGKGFLAASRKNGTTVIDRGAADRSGGGPAGAAHPDVAHFGREHFGIGMENVRRRLELCYGAGARLQLKRYRGKTEVSFLVPLQTPAEAASALRGEPKTVS